MSHGTHACTVCMFEGLETIIISEELQSVLSTNDPPNDEVLPSLLSSLDIALSVSADIDEYIASMESILSRMRRARAPYVLSIKQHKAAMHPIRSIPDDILLEIFKWHSWSGLEEQYCAPWALSFVSQRWRALALSYSSLWSTINIPARGLKNDEDYSNLASQWSILLPRSRDCDLFVQIVSNLDHVDVVLRLLSHTTRRWRYLTIKTSSLCFLSDNSFNRLTHLVLFGNSVYTERVSMFMRAPNLSSCTLYGQVNIDLLWDRITTYSCSSEGLRYVHRCTAVEHLSLTFDSMRGDASNIFPSGVPAALNLPMVRSLSMSHRSSPQATPRDISQYLHVPLLSALTIRSQTRPLPRFPIPLPHLRALCIESQAPHTDLSSFLASCSSITSLHARSVDLLQLLPVVAAQSVLLPNLTTLCIDKTLLDHYPQLVVKILESRCHDEGIDGRAAPLVELRISARRFVIRDVKDYLQTHMPRERWNVVCSKVNIIKALCPCN